MPPPVGPLAVGAAVVDQPTRTAHHAAGPVHEHQTVGAHALAALAGAGVEERADRGRLRQDVVDHEHVGEHAAHEGAEVDADHGPEAKVPPDATEEQAAVVKVGAHHAAEVVAGVERARGGAEGRALPLEHGREVRVQVEPDGVGHGVPLARVEGLEVGRVLEVIAAHHVEREVHHEARRVGEGGDYWSRNARARNAVGVTLLAQELGARRVARAVPSVLLPDQRVAAPEARVPLLHNLHKRLHCAHVKRVPRKQQPAQRGVLAVDPVLQERRGQRDVLEQQRQRQRHPAHIVRPQREQRHDDIRRRARTTGALVGGGGHSGDHFAERVAGVTF